MSQRKRVFIDLNGQFYKALESRDKSHAERSLITQEFLEALPDDGTPMYMVDIDTRIQQILDARANGGKDVIVEESFRG